MQSSADLRNIRFDKSPFGYRADDVDQFVDDAASLVAQLEAENEELMAKLEVLALKLEEYKGEEESLRAAVLGAQKLGDSIIRDSKNKAEVLLRDATTRAERMVESTQNKMERERVALTRIQKEVADFKNRLLVMYKKHLELIAAMPEMPQTGEKTPATEGEAPVQQPATEAAPVQAAPPATEYAEESFAAPLDDDDRPEQLFAEEQPAPPRYGSKYGELLFGEEFSPK